MQITVLFGLDPATLSTLEALVSQFATDAAAKLDKIAASVDKLVADGAANSAAAAELVTVKAELADVQTKLAASPTPDEIAQLNAQLDAIVAKLTPPAPPAS